MLRPPSPGLSVLDQSKETLSPCSTLVLASCLEQLDGLDPTTAGLTVFLTDWLSWMAWRQREGQAVHQEGFLADWPAELGEQCDFQRRAVSWMYEKGVDVTLFEGVSLGKQFNWEISGVRLAAGRMSAALTRALDRIKPERVEYRGLRCEYEFLDDDALFDLARRVAIRQNIPFTDGRVRRPTTQLHPELPFNGEFKPQPWRLRLTLFLAERVIDAFSRLAALAHPKAPKIFVLHNLLVVKSLIEHLPVGAATPVLFARIHPKRPSFLLNAWRKGVRLLALPTVKLGAADHKHLQDIRTAITGICLRLSDSCEDKALSGFLSRHLLTGDALEAKALEVVQFRRLFENERLARILVGDSENHMVRMACEVAQSLDIGVDELPNGMFLTAQQMDSRSGDGCRKPVIDRLLAWGDSGLRWSKRSQVAVPAIATGYPPADSLACAPVVPASGKGRALVLPLHVDKTDLCGLYSEVFSNLVAAARVAAHAGYKEIRIKVHPGFIHLDYYLEVARRFGLEAEVFKDGSLLPHIEWADVVIGPVNSGAMIETAALGRPYISILNPPTAIDPEIALPARPILVGDLAQALAKGIAEDKTLLMTGIAGGDPNNPAGKRVWSAILAEISAASTHQSTHVS